MGILDFFRRSAPDEHADAPARTGRAWQRGLRRAMESHFSAANSDRLNASWSSMPMTADAIVTKHQRVLVARSRQQSSENDYARAFLRLCRQNIVGSMGVQMQSKCDDADARLAIEKAWKAWCKKLHCDVAGRRSFRGLELAAVQSAAKDGEFMFRKIYGAAAGPWGFSLQLLDPQRCPVDHDINRYGDAGNFIRHGIEFNRYGRPMFFHFTTTDETEVEYQHGGKSFIRVPAGEIIHGFKDELGSQKRGLPWMATGLFKLRHIGGMEDAAIINARVGAAKMGFIEFEHGNGPELDADDEMHIDAEAGTFQVLPEGAKLNKWDPQYPSGEFAGFTKHMLRSIASGWGVPYNELASDLEGVNFSSIRQGTLDARERWKEDQQWLIEDLHEEVFSAWLEYSLLARRIKGKGGQPLQAGRIDEYAVVEWQPRRWTWIDPGADVKAAVESKNNLLKSPGELIRENGRDPVTVYAEIAADIEAMKAAGIPEEIIKLAFSDKLAPQPPGAPKSEKPAA